MSDCVWKSVKKEEKGKICALPSNFHLTNECYCLLRSFINLREMICELKAERGKGDLIKKLPIS